MNDQPSFTSLRSGAVTRGIFGVAVIAVGIALFFAPLTVQQIAVLTGVGIAIAGLVLLVRGTAGGRALTVGGSTSIGGITAVDDASPAAPGWLTRIAGIALTILGALMALWPDSGAPWLATIVGIALILHGIISGIAAIRGDADHRVSGVLIAATGIIVGVLVFSWPVLTLSLFRLTVGAWFVFTGVRILVALLHRALLNKKSLHRKPASVAPVGSDSATGSQMGVYEATSAQPSPTHPRGGRFRTWTRTIAAGVALLLAAGAAYGTAQLLGGTPLPVPTPFYTAPDDVPAEAGRLIRTEPLTTGVPDGAQAWRILYTTTHSDGSPAVSSGTILAPADRGDTPMPLLTVSHGTTGVVDGCSPSLSAAPFADGAGTAMAEMVTDHGWVAVISDYVGLGTGGVHPYLIGEAEARNVLDASLAAREFDELSISSDTVVWGHSQGGQGSLWTGQIANTYAPDLTVLGIAAFAPAADLYGLADADKNSVGGKVVSAYIAQTWNELFPELELEQHLTPGSAGPVERISQLCFNGQDVISAIVRGTQVPNQIFPDSQLDGPFGDLLKAQTPTGPFPAPVLVAQGLDDPLVLPPLQQQWVDDRCAEGIAIDYRTYPGLSHVSLVAADSPLTPQIVQWTLDRWDGAEPTPNCGASSTEESSGNG